MVAAEDFKDCGMVGKYVENSTVQYKIFLLFSPEKVRECKMMRNAPTITKLETSLKKHLRNDRREQNLID